MYNWNRDLIKKQIEELNKKDFKTEEILYDLNTLQDLLNNEDTENTIENFLENELDEYNHYKKYIPLIKKIINKHKYSDIESLEYNEIKITKKESIEFAKYMINKINPTWYNTLNRIITNKDILDYKRTNENSLTYLKSLNTFYISLEKKNNIDDYISPTHEFLHAYSIIKNYNFFYNIECEFLSMFGEMIIRYEMKKENFHKEEFIKSDINDLYLLKNFIIDILYRTDTIKHNIEPNKKIDYLQKKFGYEKDTLLTLYGYSLEYMYNYLISYFLAIEIFEIYKNDKEKSLYIADDIILDNHNLYKKLNKHNIKLLKSNNHIKQLKKEYTILCNQ